MKVELAHCFADKCARYEDSKIHREKTLSCKQAKYEGIRK